MISKDVQALRELYLFLGALPHEDSEGQRAAPPVLDHCSVEQDRKHKFLLEFHNCRTESNMTCDNE